MQVTYLSGSSSQAAAAQSRTSAVAVSMDGYLLEKSFFWVIKVGILTIIGLGFWYLTLLNAISTRGFELQELKAEQANIHKEIEAMDIEVTIPSSIYALQSSEKVQEMEDVNRIRYFSAREGRLAKK